MTHLPRAAIALREYLADRGLAQARFAFVELNLTDTTIQSWLAGRARPSLENALRIQKLTGIPVEDWMVEGQRGG